MFRFLLSSVITGMAQVLSLAFLASGESPQCKVFFYFALLSGEREREQGGGGGWKRY